MRRETYDTADKIYIDGNEGGRTQKLLTWWNDNVPTEKKFVKNHPLTSGIIVHKNSLSFTYFKVINDNIHMIWYKNEDKDMKRPKAKAILYQDTRVSIVFNSLFIDDGVFSDIANATAIVYNAVACFMLYYKEKIVIKEKRIKEAKSSSNRSKSHNKKRVITSREYILPDDFSDIIPIGESVDYTKRHYTLPEREVRVRGFYRHYKNGKTVWVKPHSRYKDKGNPIDKEYILKENIENI